MVNCTPGVTGRAHFLGRKDQAHDGLWCAANCKTAKRSKGKIPVPERCKTKKSKAKKRRKSKRR